MEKIMRGYIFRLYPTDKQIELIEKVLDVQDIFIIIS